MYGKYENLSIETIVKKIRSGEMGFSSVPEEKRMNKKIVSIERKLNLRVSGRRGYDIIRNKFFVEEYIKEFAEDDESRRKIVTSYFDDFKSYYEFLLGDIYQESCYWGCDFKNFEAKYHVKVDALPVKPFIDKTIDSYKLDMSKEEIKDIENEKKWIKRWVNKFDKCENYKQFKKVLNDLVSNIEIRNKYIYYMRFFLYTFIQKNQEKAFDIMMNYIEECNFSVDEIAFVLCLVYSPDKVLKEYSYREGVSQTRREHKKRIESYAKHIQNRNFEYKIKSGFDSNTGYYRVEINLYSKQSGRNFLKYYKFFESFDEFTDNLNNDLTDCDLSKANISNIDFANYKTDESTILPIKYNKDVVYQINKGYDRKTQQFYVNQIWKNSNGYILKEYNHRFNYFFDFVSFLDNDLSNADLIFCEGLENVTNIDDINVQDAKLRSCVKDKWGVCYKQYESIVNDSKPEEHIISNEMNSVVEFERELEVSIDCLENKASLSKIYYISDLHLMHKIIQNKCVTYEDVVYFIQGIVDSIKEKMFDQPDWTFSLSKKILLIGGDVSSDFSVFDLFVKTLNESLSNKIMVIFVLGNHELWSFPNYSLEEIMETYSKLLNSYGMYLLKNNMIIKNDDNCVENLNYEELQNISDIDLKEKLRCARLVFLGGIGFAGYNELFNANNGIYKNVITREQEIIESKKFESLYNQVREKVKNKDMIVFTHFPKKDWSDNDNYHNGLIYVNGHTHQNYFYYNNDYRIYADNQIGYTQKTYKLKSFFVDDSYDYFENYEDGIYRISGEEYIQFYRGVNITMLCNWNIVALYMLKKKGYYCFIHKARDKKLSILNGGQKKRLENKDVKYYYDNMDKTIEYINKPLNKYSQLQKKLSLTIQSFGGTGEIHGCIIDIDFYSHIYINPMDLTITPYYALNMVDKKVFSSVEKLLQNTNLQLFTNYQKLIEKNDMKSLIPNKIKVEKDNKEFEYYFETDMYSYSILLNRIQRLKSRILTVWIEPTSEKLLKG